MNILRSRTCSGLAALGATALLATAQAQDGAAASATTAEPGNWQPRQIELTYMGFTSTYSCDGLQSKLEFLLRQFGARPGFKVVTYGCPDGYGHPSRFVRARLEFSSLSPASGDSTPPAASAPPSPPVQGIWRTVELEPHRPFDLQSGDCELIEQFRDRILPLFTTRDPEIRITCVPYQDTGASYDMKLQVFAPAAAATAAAAPGH